MCVCVKPVSETEIGIWYDHDDEFFNIIPNTVNAIRAWVEDLGGGNEIEAGYVMETDPAMLSTAGHEALGKNISKIVNDYNRPHTVAHWVEIHGEETAARLENKYFN